jgi:SET domain-containing protein
MAPVIIFGREDRKKIDETVLYNYIFDWDIAEGQSCMALGYVPMYNHAFQANCDYEMDHEALLIRIKTTRDIAEGEELFINYNGASNDPRPVWFEVS